ncbi:MAG: hypothetical protein JSS63_03645 [Bacteroidetes bacterium]|nr:hypothetical protein [Bacteroidota bacterium]
MKPLFLLVLLFLFCNLKAQTWIEFNDDSLTVSYYNLETITYESAKTYGTSYLTISIKTVYKTPLKVPSGMQITYGILDYRFICNNAGVLVYDLMDEYRFYTDKSYQRFRPNYPERYYFTSDSKLNIVYKKFCL